MRFIREVVLGYDGDECLAWPFSKSGGGYGTLWIDGRMATASRYICELVNGAPPTPEHEAAHSCGKGHEGCVTKGHLDWKTPAQNQADRIIHGTHYRGERNANSKITEAEAREILALKGVEPQCKIANRLRVSSQTVSKIHSGHSWAWLSVESEDRSNG
ncbi:hypothetical protein E0H46_31935 [Rhizobium leguminosarum bv. viciae]|nr:hypothetical protein E0H46_31935 [Rhizobium leguminosarum bv. viciae]